MILNHQNDPVQPLPEFQGRSYDMLIGHATLVCVRYIFFELERRRTLEVRTNALVAHF